MTADLGMGRFQYCLNVKDLEKSEGFYSRLGFQQIGGNKEEGYLVLRKEDCELGLFMGIIPANGMNFRGGNIAEIVTSLKGRDLAFKSEPFIKADGGGSAFLEDPDGNVLFFDSTPQEVLDYQEQQPLLKKLGDLRSG